MTISKKIKGIKGGGMKGGGTGGSIDGSIFTMTISIVIALMILLIFICVIYLFVFDTNRQPHHHRPSTTTILSSSLPPSLSNPYVPPLQPVYGLPSIETQPVHTEFRQVGILASEEQNGLILPLMGRQIQRQKWQYYTLSNTGGIHSKLPVRVNGRDGTQEYGVDELSHRENVYVDGYNNNFLVSVWNNQGFSYNPFSL